MSAALFSEPAESKNNARAFKRFAIQFSVSVRILYDFETPNPKPSSSSVTASVTNISMSGLCFEAPEPFDLNSYLLLKITLGLRSFELPVIVRHRSDVARATRMMYACGVQFVKCESVREFIPALAKYLIARGLFH